MQRQAQVERREESVPRHSGASVKSQVDTSLVVIALGFLCNISMSPTLELSASQSTECRILTNKLVPLGHFFDGSELIMKCQIFSSILLVCITVIPNWGHAMQYQA